MELFSNKPRKVYDHNLLKEVICQFRFPAILSLDVSSFQKHIRKNFPDFGITREEQQEIFIPNNFTNEPQAKISSSFVNNYCFRSFDGNNKVNIVNNFIALSTNAYTSWDGFWSIFNDIMSLFIVEYEPMYFERIGLRYIDAISRKELGIETKKWNELINPSLLGIMGASDLDEGSVISNSCDTHIRLSRPNSFLKLHTGIGLVNDNPETQFIIDSDFYSTDRVNATDFASAKDSIDYLHEYSGKLLRGCITDLLEGALGVKNS